MIAPPLHLDVRARRPVPDKAIMWPTVAGYGDNGGADSTRFPGLTEIKARKAAQPPAALAAFAEELELAQERVLILDDYLFKPDRGTVETRLDHILNWFTESFRAGDVRLLTSSLGSADVEADIAKQCSERAQWISSLDPYAAVTISVKFTLQIDFPYVHDRFAIIDDDLWHFGATAGGLHAQVNAATRGWVAEDHGARGFFDLAWDGDDDLARRRRKRPARKR